MTRSVTRPDSDEGSRILFGETSSAIGAIAAIALCVFGTLFNLYTIIALYLSKLRNVNQNNSDSTKDIHKWGTISTYPDLFQNAFLYYFDEFWYCHIENRRHPTTLCVISLAISDLIFSAFNLPVMAHRLQMNELSLGFLRIQNWLEPLYQGSQKNAS